MTIKDLIYAIGAGKATEAQAAFETLTAEKVSTAIETRRQEIAQSMFASDEEDETVSDEAVVEEEVEQLDELSVETLKSYRKGVLQHKAPNQKTVDNYNRAGEKIAAKKKAVKEEVDQLDEAVSHHDIDYAGHRHAELHHSYEKTVPGHAKRVLDHENSIVANHGAKALKHIQKNTELFHQYHAEEQASKTPMNKEQFMKKYGSKMEEHLKAARSASLEHQKTQADLKPTHTSY